MNNTRRYYQHPYHLPVSEMVTESTLAWTAASSHSLKSSGPSRYQIVRPSRKRASAAWMYCGAAELVGRRQASTAADEMAVGARMAAAVAGSGGLRTRGVPPGGGYPHTARIGTNPYLPFTTTLSSSYDDSPAPWLPPP